jgi:RimJ/RimL family protein N-acetyltransferase
MRLVYGANEAVAYFVARLIDDCARSDFGECTAIGVVDNWRLVGGFVFHNYNPGAGVVEVSFAGMHGRWLTRRVLRAAFSYVFDQLQCQLAVARTPASLETALRIARAYGFEQVRVRRLFGRHEDGVISTLTAEAWRSNGFHKENAEQGADFLGYAKFAFLV